MVRCYISHINETNYSNEIQGSIAKIITAHVLLKAKFISELSAIEDNQIDKQINKNLLILMNSDEYKEDERFMRK